MKRILFLLLICFAACMSFPLSAFAQGAERMKVAGAVLDSAGNAVEGAAVVWLSLPDSMAVASGITDAAGRFELELDSVEEPRSSAIVVSCVGFSRKSVAVKQGVGNYEVRLGEALHSIKGVTVTAKSKMEGIPGGYVFTPGGVDMKLKDGFQVVRFAPLLTVGDKGIQILGKSGQAMILINGRSPRMPDDIVMQMLHTAEPKDIKGIEILQNPGVQYGKADGGVVNIIMKRPDYGFVGNAMARAWYSSGANLTGRTYLGYSHGRTNLSAGFVTGYRDATIKTSEYYNYKSNSTEIWKDVSPNEKSKYVSGNLNAKYELAPSSAIGMSLDFTLSDQKGELATNSVNYNNGVEDGRTRSLSLSRTPLKRPEYGASLYYYTETDKKGSTLDVEANYSNKYSSTKDTMQLSRLAKAGGYENYDMFAQNSLNKGYGYGIGAKWTKYYNRAVWTSGLSASYGHLDNDFVKSDFSNGGYVVDESSKARMIYDETLYCAYSEFTKKWYDWFVSNVGLRLEYDRRKYDGVAVEKMTDSNVDLIPRASLTFLVLKYNIVGLSYTTSMSRPYYKKMYPQKTWTSDNTYYQGNPYLQATRFHWLTFDWRFIFGLTVGCNYSYQDNFMKDYIVLHQDNTTSQGTANLGEAHLFETYADYTKSFVDGRIRLNAKLQGVYESQKGSLDGVNLDADGFYWNISSNVSFFLGKNRDWELWLSAYCNNRHKVSSMIFAAQPSASMGLNKDFGKYGSLELYLNVEKEQRRYYDTPDYYYNIKNVGFASNFNCYVTYSIKFGKKHVQSVHKRINSEFDNRMSNR